MSLFTSKSLLYFRRSFRFGQGILLDTSGHLSGGFEACVWKSIVFQWSCEVGSNVISRGSCDAGIILALCFRSLTWANYCTFAAHAWGRCAVRSFVYGYFQHPKDMDVFQDLMLSCLDVPFTDSFPCGQARFEMYFDSTRNIQYMHLPIGLCRTLEIYSLNDWKATLMVDPPVLI